MMMKEKKRKRMMRKKILWQEMEKQDPKQHRFDLINYRPHLSVIHRYVIIDMQHIA